MTLDPRFQAIPLTTSDHLLLGEDGSVRSTRFDDFYFHPGQGKEESQHVFLDGNQLAQRWRKLFGSGESQSFVIAETGFGTGLNFLATVDLWMSSIKNCNHANDQIEAEHYLHYYSFEKFPLSQVALQQTIEHYNPFPELSEKLTAIYPDPVAGQFFIDLRTHGLPVKLYLFFCDASEGIAQLEILNHSHLKSNERSLRIDAWFLDGFAPSENESMWSEPVFNAIASLSQAETTLATFTVAGSVKRGLSTVGFTLEKTPGFGKKREMLTGVFRGNPLNLNSSTNDKTVHKGNKHSAAFWRYANPSSSSEHVKTAAVIGAGIAGCHIASSLAKKGIAVDLYESDQKLAPKASGNQIAALHPRTAKQRGFHSDFLELAFHYAYQHYPDLMPDNLSNGLLQIDSDLLASTLAEPSKDKHSKLSSRQTLAASNLFINNSINDEDGIYYPDAGALYPDETVSELCKHSKINRLANHTVAKIHATAITDHNSFSPPAVDYLDSNQSTHVHQKNYDAIVIAAGVETNTLFANSFDDPHLLPTKSIGGQTTTLSIPIQNDTQTKGFDLRLLNPELANKVLCGQGYLLIAHDEEAAVLKLHVGASYRLDDDSYEPRIHDLYENLDKAADLMALHPNAYPFFIDLVADIRNDISNANFNEECTLETRIGKIRLENHVAVRCTSPDYLPMVGPIADAAEFNLNYQLWGKDANKQINTPCSLKSGLYVCTALGSHGFGTAPILAEAIVADILGTPNPLSEPLRQALSPQRFLLRQLIRGDK